MFDFHDPASKFSMACIVFLFPIFNRSPIHSIYFNCTGSYFSQFFIRMIPSIAFLNAATLTCFTLTTTLLCASPNQYASFLIISIARYYINPKITVESKIQ